MTAQELLRAGKAGEAVQKLTAEVREHPADAPRRIFLFEMLSFLGEYDRAAKHLEVLARASDGAGLGALLYKSALAAERSRQELFRSGTYPDGEASASHAGFLNGIHFQSLQDADPRIGARLEVHAAGQCLWIPFEHIDYIEAGPPRRLRDLLWIPALVRTGPAFRHKELGDVLLPALAPLTFEHTDDAVKLGRVTEWVRKNGLQVPVGQKLLLAGDEEIPFLDIRTIEFDECAQVVDVQWEAQ